jgi:hypothetical protein
MPWVGFVPTIPVFEGAKTVHALDRAATMIGISIVCTPIHNSIYENFVCEAHGVSATQDLSNILTLSEANSQEQCKFSLL